MAIAVAAVPVQRAAGTPQEVLLAHPVLVKVSRRKVPTIPPSKRVRISSRNTQVSFPDDPLFLLQLNLPTGAVAEAVAVAAEEVIGTVPEVIGKVSVVVGDVHMIVTVLQARRTHLCFYRETDIFIPNLYQRLGKEDPPILGW